MPIYQGNTKSGKLEFQNRIIKEGYYGSTLVYQKKPKEPVIIRPKEGAGTVYWTVPSGVRSVDIFLVGGGGSGGGAYDGTNANDGISGRPTGGGGGGGYCNTWIGVPVTPGQRITIVIGGGGIGVTPNAHGRDGGYTQFMNANYRVEGGSGGQSQLRGLSIVSGGSGGSGGGSGVGIIGGYNAGSGGIDGGNGTGQNPGIGIGNTTRDFGESTGSLNASGGNYRTTNTYGDGGNGSGAGYFSGRSSQNGNAGTCLIRYWV